MKSKFIIPPWKMKLIRQDIEMYLSGQITLKKIAKNHKVPYGRVIKISDEMVSDQIRYK